MAAGTHYILAYSSLLNGEDQFSDFYIHQYNLRYYAKWGDFTEASQAKEILEIRILCLSHILYIQKNHHRGKRKKVDVRGIFEENKEYD